MELEQLTLMNMYAYEVSFHSSLYSSVKQLHVGVLCVWSECKNVQSGRKIVICNCFLEIIFLK